MKIEEILKEKQAQVGLTFIIIVAAIIVGGFALMTFGGGITGLFAFGDGDDDGTEIVKSVVDESCNVASVTGTYNDKDIELPGTDPSSGLRVISEIKLDGTDLMFLGDAGGADDSGITFNTLKKFTALAGNASTTYYKKKIEFESGCSNFNIITQLANTATPTTIVKNSDDGDTNTISNAQPLGANDVDTEVTIKYDQSSNNYWGNPNIVPARNIVTCQYDKSDIQNIKVDDASSGSAPAAFGFATDPGGAGLYDGDNTFVIPSLLDGGDNTLTIMIDASSSEPGTGNFTCLFADANIDINEEDLTFIEGVEDEDTNPIYLSLFNVTVFYS